jgi:hypothetical protein
MKNLKTFEEQNNKDFNGIIYLWPYGDKTLHYWVYIKDNTAIYNRCLNINSIDAIRTDMFILSDYLGANKITSDYTCTEFASTIERIFDKKISVYGLVFNNNIANNIIEVIEKIKPGELPFEIVGLEEIDFTNKQYNLIEKYF